MRDHDRPLADRGRMESQRQGEAFPARPGDAAAQGGLTGLRSHRLKPRRFGGRVYGRSAPGAFGARPAEGVGGSPSCAAASGRSAALCASRGRDREGARAPRLALATGVRVGPRARAPRVGLEFDNGAVELRREIVRLVLGARVRFADHYQRERAAGHAVPPEREHLREHVRARPGGHEHVEEI